MARNADLETWSTSLQWKQKVTDADGVYAQVSFLQRKTGDITPHYDPVDAVSGFRVEERHDPNLLLGWHHQWSSESQTLLLLGRFAVDYALHHPYGPVRLLATTNFVDEAFIGTDLDHRYASQLNLYSVEFQQIHRHGSHTFVGGFRHQQLEDELRSKHVRLDFNAIDYEEYFPSIGIPVSNQHFDTDSRRESTYLYDYWNITTSFTLFGGIAYDALSYPRNTLNAPLGEGQRTVEAWSPKIGALWRATDTIAIRAVYGESLGGSDLDQSVRLEPAHFASLPVAFRNLFPGALVGGVSGARQETTHVVIEWEPSRDWFFSLGYQHLGSKARRTVGGYESDRNTFSNVFNLAATSFDQKLNHRETAVEIFAHRMIGRDCTLHAAYRIAEARLRLRYPGVSRDLIPENISFSASERGVLHQASAGGKYQHPSGFFSSASLLWLGQHLADGLSALTDETTFMFDLEAGFRSHRGRAEISAGLLNAFEKDYRIHPVNLAPAYERGRTLLMRIRFNF